MGGAVGERGIFHRSLFAQSRDTNLPHLKSEVADSLGELHYRLSRPDP